jgi:hypothetical protein
MSARASGAHVFFHVAAGGVKVDDPKSSTMRNQREVALPAAPERVRAPPGPRFVPGRPDGRRLPQHPGLSTIMWGNDYPHAEGTFRRSRELLVTQFAGVPDEERALIVGGSLGALLGFEAPARV